MLRVSQTYENLVSVRKEMRCNNGRRCPTYDAYLFCVVAQVLAQLHLKTTLAEPAGRLFSLCVNQNYVQVNGNICSV